MPGLDKEQRQQYKKAFTKIGAKNIYEELSLGNQQNVTRLVAKYDGEQPKQLVNLIEAYKEAEQKQNEPNESKWEQVVELYESRTTLAQKTSKITEILLEKHDFKTPRDSQKLWRFGNPVYENDGEQLIREEVYNQLSGYAKNSHVKEVIEEIKARTYCIREDEQAPPNIIPVENGWYNRDKDELVEPDPEYFVINHVPVKYDEDADCPRIKSFVSEIVREEDVPLVQEMIGFCLHRDYPLERAFMLLGQGGNGKSTLINLIEEFLGPENVSNPSLQKLSSSDHASAELYGKLANMHADLSNQAVKNSGTFKMLCGGDYINAERKWEHPFKFKNYAKLIFSANELPKTYDTSEAYFRRWIILDFPYKFTSKNDDGNKDKDPDLPESILTEEELSGLFNWAVEGLNRVLDQNGFSQTAGREAVKYRWLKETQPVQIYFNEGFEEKAGSTVPKDELYQHYIEFCNVFGVTDLSREQFFKQLRGACPAVNEKRERMTHGRRRVMEGIKLKEIEEVVQVVQGKLQCKTRVRTDTNKEQAITLDHPDHPDALEQMLKEKEHQNIGESIIDAVKKNDEDVGAEIVDVMEDIDRSFNRTEELMNELEEEGKIFEPKPGYWRVL